MSRGKEGISSGEGMVNQKDMGKRNSGKDEGRIRKAMERWLRED